MSADAEADALEAELAELLRQGERAPAATRILQQLGPGILGYQAGLLGDDELAREAFSDFAEALWKALPRFEGRSRVKTFAYAIAYRCALRQRRARARRRTRPLRDSEVSRVAAAVASTHRSFARTEAEQKLDALRAGLSDEERTLLVLRMDRGMAYRDIAEVLGERGAAGEAAVRKRFQRLKQRLRRAAAREGLISG